MLKTFLKFIVVHTITFLAHRVLKKYKPYIFAVTGSVGKTSTKDALYTVLNTTSGKSVRRNEKSFNSETGVPLTILGRPNGWYSISSWLGTFYEGLRLLVTRVEYPEILVLEVGADKPRDIYDITRWLKPDISIMTKIGRIAVHVEFFDSPEALIQEKSYLLDETKKGGHIILSADDEEVMKAGEGRDTRQGLSITTFGINQSATVRVQNIEVVYNEDEKPLGMKADIVWPEGREKLMVRGALGNQFIYPSIAALASAYAYGIDPRKGIQALSNHIPSKGRMNILEGKNNAVILDDTYNSSPDAVREAYKALGMLTGKKCQRKIAILGDMMELGKYSTEQHIKIGEEIAHVLGDNGLLITVGQRAQGFAKGAENTGMNKDRIIVCDTSRHASEYIEQRIAEGDVVLIKASQSIRAEIITESILKDKRRAGELLVRQEKEWKAKL